MAEKSAGAVAEIFAAFLKLGLTSFGGPIAHLGYFRAEFVERRKWLSESSYADIVALCQFLPGPASSQVGFTIGILRGNGLLRRARGVVRLHHAVGAHSVRLRARRDRLHRPCRRRDSPRPETGRGGRRRAGDLGHGQEPDAGSNAGSDRACGCCDRGLHRRIVWPGRRHRAWSHGRALAMPRRMGRRLPAISALRYRLDTARSHSCCSRPCS